MAKWGSASDFLAQKDDAEGDQDELKVHKFEIETPAFFYLGGATLREVSHRLPEENQMGQVVRCLANSNGSSGIDPQAGSTCPLCGHFPVETAVLFAGYNLANGKPTLIRGTSKKVGTRDVRRAQSLVSRLAAFLPNTEAVATVEIVKPSAYQFTVTGRPDLREKAQAEFSLPDLLERVKAEAEDILERLIPQFSAEEILADPVIAEYLRLRRKP